MKRTMITMVALATLTIAYGNVASAHFLPWRAGENRTKGFGQCAKGACSKRMDFSAGKPHHHHGSRIVLGSNEHTSACRG